MLGLFRPRVGRVRPNCLTGLGQSWGAWANLDACSTALVLSSSKSGMLSLIARRRRPTGASPTLGAHSHVAFAHLRATTRSGRNDNTGCGEPKHEAVRIGEHGQIHSLGTHAMPTEHACHTNAVPV